MKILDFLGELIKAAAPLAGVWLGVRLNSKSEDRRLARERSERLDQTVRDKLDFIHDCLTTLRRQVDEDTELAASYVMQERKTYSPYSFSTLDEVVKITDLYLPALDGPCKELIDAFSAYRRARAPIELESEIGSPREDNVRALRIAQGNLRKAIGGMTTAVGESMRRTLAGPVEG